MEFAVPVLILLIGVINPLQSVIDTKWRSKTEVGEKRSWIGDLMRAPGTRWWFLVRQSLNPYHLVSALADLEVEIFRWCGQGDGADSVEDLGGYTGTDR